PLRARALRLLARREHSRLELARKLAHYTEDHAGIEQVIDDLERRGWLSEQRVVEQVAASKRRRFGARRIAREVWRRKFGALPANARDKARQIRFLQGRGFDLEIILKLFKSNETADERG